jgi:hypothetical protein
MVEGGKSVSELVKIWGGGAERALGLVRDVRGEALLDAALASGKGVIIAAPHLGCWELLNYWLCRKTPMAILYRPPRIAAIEGLLRKVRGALAPVQIRADGAGVRTLYKRLAAGGTVGILPDQKPRAGEGQCALGTAAPDLDEFTDRFAALDHHLTQQRRLRRVIQPGPRDPQIHRGVVGRTSMLPKHQPAQSGTQAVQRSQRQQRQQTQEQIDQIDVEAHA